jgi:hypothetical protein
MRAAAGDDVDTGGEAHVRYSALIVT